MQTALTIALFVMVASIIARIRLRFIGEYRYRWPLSLACALSVGVIAYSDYAERDLTWFFIMLACVLYWLYSAYDDFKFRNYISRRVNKL